MEYESDGERTQAKEIRKLRAELRHYMKRVEELQHEKPAVLKNKDKRIKKRKREDLRLSDEEEDKRQAARLEEQAARSARMLYTLQRQVGSQTSNNQVSFLSLSRWYRCHMDDVFLYNFSKNENLQLSTANGILALRSNVFEYPMKRPSV